jgi:predicted nucleic acid-binding protein
LYLDNCCFNRPFDDQRQARIRSEAEAKLTIQERVRAGDIQLVWSYILDYENSANPFEERRRTIYHWRSLAQIEVFATEAVVEAAKSLVRAGLKTKDALHIACAIAGGCDFFVTTDDEILHRREDVQGIKILNPTDVVREVSG